MGIRCYCPNGHRLNLKVFQAGRVGICPQCQARFRIPLESEPKRELPAGGSPGSPDPPYEDEEAEAAEEIGPVEAPTAVAPVGATPGATIPTSAPAAWDIAEPTSGIGAVPTPAPVVPAPVAPPPEAAPQPIDPIAQAPNAVWYVRPPTGGQYGPAKGEIMRRWVDEGRVTPDSLVWREGWDDWCLAEGVFT